ncbi:MAG TPA: hypothetical protein PKD64_17435 [Pirellulaceae bacterium]|nr:hypothetical protein [Pirellulaceae bacterium]HMO93971.1 hypothetical protein [Pirellulaceae bacterium]HMP70829.1 hypothetical protein [Pirellulaceae bacterium]
MARETFLLRTDKRTLDALRRWAEDELRSVNGQLEYLLRKSLREAGRLDSANKKVQQDQDEETNRH